MTKLEQTNRLNDVQTATPMIKYTTTGKQTLIEDEKAAQKLSKIGNSLEKLDSVIYFEMWRNQLANHNTKNYAEAKQYDVVVMFKVMVLRQHFKLNHDQTEYQIIDCNSFKQLFEQIVDASFVHAPRQRNTPEENEKSRTSRVMIYGTTTRTINGRIR